MFESPSFKNANSRTICSENVVEMRGKTSYLGARLCLGYKEQMKGGSVVNLERTTNRCDNIEGGSKRTQRKRGVIGNAAHNSEWAEYPRGSLAAFRGHVYLSLLIYGRHENCSIRIASHH